MSDLSLVHDGRPVVQDQVFGWRDLERVWRNFSVIVAVLLKEHGLDGSHTTLAAALADLAAHLADTNNPHQVTTTQIGALPSYTFTAHLNTTNPHNITRAMLGAAAADALAALETAFNAHAANSANPHATTAAQVGAPTLADLAALAALLEAHKGDATNPHSTTAVQVGAAPFAHVGSRDGHPLATLADAGFMGPLHVQAIDDHEARIDVLENAPSAVPLGGTFVYDKANGRWTSPNAVGVGAIATEVATGAAQVVFSTAFASADAYRAVVTPHLIGEKKAIVPLIEKAAASIVVTLLTGAESSGESEVDFDLVIVPG